MGIRIDCDLHPVHDGIGVTLNVEGWGTREDAAAFAEDLRAMLVVYFDEKMPHARVSGGPGSPPWKAEPTKQ